MKNYYEILQVKNFATDKEIKKSFRQLAIKYHPDKNKGRKDYEENFKEIANAYAILTNVQKKRDFDFQLSQQYLKYTRPDTTNQTNYSERKRQNNTEEKRENKKEFKIPIFWIIVIVVLIIYLISNSDSENKTTTGNTKADKELEKNENSKKPKTGEIDFKK